MTLLFRNIALLSVCCCLNIRLPAQKGSPKDPPEDPAKMLCQYVDPMIGSEGLGRVFIGPSYPFGMIKPGPDCTSRPNSGWLPAPAPVTGFGQVHVSGTGGGPKYGNILIMPFSGDPDKLEQSSLRENEKATLGDYCVTLKKDGIQAEITATERVAFYRFTYPHREKKSLKIDAGFFLGEQPEPDAREAQQFVGSEIEVVSDTEVRGYSRIRGGWNNGGAYTVYFDAIFDRAVSKYVTWKGDRLYPGIKGQFDSGEKTGVLLSFAERGHAGGRQGTAGSGRAPAAVRQGSAAGPDSIKVKVGISFISSLKARENVGHEIPHWSFERILIQIRNKWEELLHRVEIDPDATADQKKLFYTALYHTMLMPVNRTGENPLWTNDEPYYDDFYAIWDTFRSSNPLITLISPSREVEIVNSLLNIYKHDGYMPDSRSGNYNGRTQGGSNAEVLIADAFVKGLKGINYSQAMDAMLKDATVPPGGNEEKEGRGGLTDYNRLGYVSYDFVRSGNRTLDYAYDDYCIAMVAKGLGKRELYERFIKQAGNWQHLWRDNYEDHGAKGFIMPKDASGKWLDSIPYGESRHHQKPNFIYTPLSREYPWYVCHWCGFFYEATSWEYSLSIPHQIPDIIARSGGPGAFRRRLDTLFDKSYYNVSNEPSFLTPCLYHWIGRPDLSGLRIRQIITRNYNTTHFGLPGNDDSGAMSSWLAFHMMGLYPNAGQSFYLLNPPLISRIVIHQENGRDFTIIKNGSSENSYVKTVTLNGHPLDQAWIEHEDILRGGELVFEMGAAPSAWGTAILPPVKN